MKRRDTVKVTSTRSRPKPKAASSGSGARSLRATARRRSHAGRRRARARRQLAHLLARHAHRDGGRHRPSSSRPSTSRVASTTTTALESPPLTHRLAFAALALLFGLSIALGSTELLLRLTGHRPCGVSDAPFIASCGFSDVDADRAVASAPWLRTLAQLASCGHVATPYATLADDGAAVLHPPTAYPSWWLHEAIPA